MSSVATERFLEPVRTFADNILEHGRDPFGQTPLFVDAVDPERDEPAAYDTTGFLDSIGKSDRICCNLASQQEFFRVLVGLTELTGNEKYRKAAEEAIRYGFENATDTNGLLYWGVSCTFDLETKQPLHRHEARPAHCLKSYYPYYQLMWETDPAATERFIESFWNAHIYDWAILDFDRWALYNQRSIDTWEYEYLGGEPFFWGDGLTFVNAGSDLYYAAAKLAEFSDQREPLEWAHRLAHRYVETRHPDIGISGYQFSQSKHAGCADAFYGDPRRERCKSRGDRAQHQFAPYLPKDHVVYEGTIFRPRPAVQRAQLRLSETLEDSSDTFSQWPLEEIRAWGGAAYRPEDNSFEPMLTDGYSLDGFVHQRDGYFGKEGDEVEPIPATAEFFWLYAYAFRLSEDGYLWEMAADIGSGLGLGGIGESDGTDIALTPDRVAPDYRLLFGLLELYRATGEQEYLEAAVEQGAALVDEQFVEGYFVRERSDEVSVTGDKKPQGGAEVSVIGSHAPLSVLHLAAAIEGELASIPDSGGATLPYEK